MKRKRIERAIEIIQYAKENNLSLRTASCKFGYSPTYLKNIKISMNELKRKKRLDNEILHSFFSTYNDYKESVNPTNNTVKHVSNTIVTENKDRNDMSLVSKSSDIKHIKTVDDLLKEANVDLKLWKIRDYSINKWDVTSFKTKTPITRQNFQVNVKLEKNEEVNKEMICGEVFNEMTKNYIPPLVEKHDVLNFNNRTNKENNLFEISIFDLHLGKLAWCGETGENFDTKIASERFIKSIKELVFRALLFGFERILFPVGNDFFNSDNLFNTTTNGTPQDEDLRWQKTFSLGFKLLVDGINILKQTGKPVDVLVIPGNHDFQRSYYVGVSLEAWFRDDPMVNINNGASPRKYYNFGDVLLGFTHGKYEKESSLPMLMATENESKKLWSKTKFREWHVGHIHRKRNVNYMVVENNKTLNEDFGVFVRHLSSLTGTEEWHHKRGFVSQIKAADGFIWNDKEGLVAHINTNIIL